MNRNYVNNIMDEINTDVKAVKLYENLILNLDFLPERYENTIKELGKTNLIFFTTERISAINGFELEGADRVEKHLKVYGDMEKYGLSKTEERYDTYREVMRPLQRDGKLDKEYKGVIKPGTLGNYLSFHKILTHIVDTLPDGCVTLVLEDDITIPDPTEVNKKISDILDEFPTDADIVYLGTSIFTKMDITRATKDLYKIVPTDDLVTAGLFGVFITKKGAQKLLKNWFPMKRYSDVEFGHRIKTGDIIAYTTKDNVIDVKYEMSYTNCGTKDGVLVNYDKRDDISKSVNVINDTIHSVTKYVTLESVFEDKLPDNKKRRINN
jgi:GR25 family glycosyltransferase involved in LPS biosynthesis